MCQVLGYREQVIGNRDQMCRLSINDCRFQKRGRSKIGNRQFRSLFPVLSFLICVAAANLWARPGKTETVSYKSGGEAVTGYLALPDSAGPHPAIVVIHEWWGLNDWMKEQAQKFAQQGYVASAVDLYRGKVATDRDTAHELSRGMPQDRAYVT